jgi:uncharacterized membrane protein
MKDKKRRTIIKSITFRIVATIATVLIVYFATGNLALANTIGVIDLVSKLLIYYLHERAWERVSWGKTREGITVANQ